MWSSTRWMPATRVVVGAGVVAAALVAIALPTAASAAVVDLQAWQDLSLEQRQAITDNVLRAQGIDATPYSVAKGTAQNYFPERIAEATWEGEAQVSRANFGGTNFSTAQLRTRIRASVLPRFLPSGGWTTITSRAIPVVGAFVMGLEIGTALNKLYIDVDAEPVGPTTARTVEFEWAKDGPLYAANGGYSSSPVPSQPDRPVVPQGMLAARILADNGWVAANLQTGDACQDLRPNPSNFLAVDGIAYGRCYPEAAAKAFYWDPTDVQVNTRGATSEPAHWSQYSCCSWSAKLPFPPLPSASQAEPAIEDAYESANGEFQRAMWVWIFDHNPPASDPDYDDPTPTAEPVFDPDGPGALTRARCNPESSPIKMPSITVGESAADYEQCLEQLGIETTVQTLPESDLEVANGEVVETDPEPGTTVDPQTVIATIAANPATRVKSDNDPRCEHNPTPGDPGAAPADGSDYPQYQDAPAPWSDPYPGFDPALHPPHAESIPLRYGEQEIDIDDGWGWRHIRAKHGYGAEEQQATQQALASDPSPTLRFASTRQWVFHYYYKAPDGSGGEIDCVRSVPVQFDADRKQLGMDDQTMKGIITSYTGILVGIEP